MQRSMVISSMIYKFGERFFMKIFGLIVLTVLARHVVPQDFGFLAILMVSESFAEVFANCGLPTALVQGKDVEDADFSLAFYTGFGISVLFVIGLFFAAPQISLFYRTEKLIWPLRVISLLLIVNAFNGIKIARLQRKMYFRAQMICQVIAVFGSGVLGIYMATQNYGLWALVSYVGSQGLLLSLLLILADRWIPDIVFNWDRVKRLISFGSKILGVNLLNKIYDNFRTLFIGKQFEIVDLAYYDRGKWIPEVVAGNYDTTIQSVMLPTLSREQDNVERVHTIVRSSVAIGLLVLTPVLVELVLLAKPLIVLLITEKWLPAVEYMQILTIGFVTMPVVSTLMTGVVALGYGSTDLRVEIYRKLVLIGVLLYSILAYDSVMAIAQWFVIGNIVDLVLVICLTKEYVGYGLGYFVQDFWKVFVASAFMGVVVYWIITLGLSNIVTILLSFVLGGLIYCLVNWLLKNDAFVYLINLVKLYHTGIVRR